MTDADRSLNYLLRIAQSLDSIAASMVVLTVLAALACGFLIVLFLWRSKP